MVESCLKKAVREIQNDIQIVKDKLILKINELPDNSKIERISKNCFIMNYKDLGDNWSPLYHDYKRQYNIIVDIINKYEITHVLVIFGLIINVGTIKYNNENVKFHPTVREYLKSL
jgi:hypothetical protein